MSVIGTTGTPFSTALAVRGKRVKQATARPSMDVPAGAALPPRAARGGQKPARAGGTAEASRRGRRVGRTPQGGAGGGQAQRPALGSPPTPHGGSPALSHSGGGGEHFVAFVVVTVTQRAPPGVWSQKQGC